MPGHFSYPSRIKTITAFSSSYSDFSTPTLQVDRQLLNRQSVTVGLIECNSLALNQGKMAPPAKPKPSMKNPLCGAQSPASSARYPVWYVSYYACFGEKPWHLTLIYQGNQYLLDHRSTLDGSTSRQELISRNRARKIWITFDRKKTCFGKKILVLTTKAETS